MFVIVICFWVILLSYWVYRDDAPFVYEQKLLEKYQLPFRFNALYIGSVVTKKLKLPYAKWGSISFVRYGDILFQEGTGQALHDLVWMKQVTLLAIGVPIVLALMEWRLHLGLLSLMLLLLLVYNERYRFVVQYRHKQELMTSELSQVLFQFVLLVSAGHTIMTAFEKVAYSKNGMLYQEMQRCMQAIEYGVPNVQALVNFSSRCDDADIKRMINLLMQTQQKGSSEMSRLFFEMSQMNWIKEKARVMKRAQSAATQLLLPSGLIFLGIIIMMMLPLLLNSFSL